jgi:hypothetical protein
MFDRKRSLRALSATVIGAAALATVPSAAHAEWYFTKRGAQKVARDYVADYYSNTYYEDLVASCRPQGESRPDPRYKYHRWVCVWYDTSDDTSGRVLVVGSDSAGAYYGRVLNGGRVR